MSRRGFTLVEVIVALALMGVAALIAHGLFTAAVTGAATLEGSGHRMMRRANAVRWLESAWRNLDVGSPEAGGFAGSPDGAEFTAWLLVPDGWAERRRVSLAARNGALVAAAGADSLRLMDDVAYVELDYLLEPGADTRWVRAWTSPVSAPVAVRMRIARRLNAGAGAVDTLLFLVKGRG